MTPERGAALCRQAIAATTARRQTETAGGDSIHDRALARARADQAAQRAAELAARRGTTPSTDTDQEPDTP